MTSCDLEFSVVLEIKKKNSTWIIAHIINIEQVTLNIYQYTLPEVAICVVYK